jgi:hypothetical protein
MGWKTINGRQYYYRSVREGRRVRSEYVGGGEAGWLMAQIQRIDSQGLMIERRQEKDDREEWGEIEAALNDLHTDARRAATAALTAAGYHQHNRGEWRKKRG